MFQGLEFCGAVLFCHDLGFSISPCVLILADQLPINGAIRAVNEKTREGKKIEEFQSRAIIDCATKFTNPYSITESRKLVEFIKGRWCGVSVSLP